MKGKLLYLGVLLLVVALAISGCVAAVVKSSPPGNPVGACDAVLAYLSEHYGDQAPAAGLAWVAEHTPPEGLVGGESYQYASGDWVIAVSYPVVAPGNEIYTVQVSNPATGFRWDGQLDAQRHVSETSTAMPNPASAYCEEQGGTLEMREDASGGVAGVCVFPDGSECDEWAYFRGECQPGGSLATS